MRRESAESEGDTERYKAEEGGKSFAYNENLWQTTENRSFPILPLIPQSGRDSTIAPSALFTLATVPLSIDASRSEGNRDFHPCYKAKPPII